MKLNLTRLFFATIACSATYTAAAQTAPCYTLASIQGNYALVGTYGANIGIALGIRFMDGNGNLTGTFVVNEPLAGSTTGQRTTVTGTQKGTYTVKCDGTGVITRILTLADGTTSQGYDDFMITSSVLQDGQLIATGISDAQRTPSAIVPGGIFLSRTYTRLPNTANSGFGSGCYNLESLQGTYMVSVNYGANVGLGMQPESLDGKGNLRRTGVLNQPVAGSATGERTVGTVTSTGTYTVNCNGSGTIDRVVTRPDGTKATATDDFIVTGAIVKDGKLLATSLIDAQRDPSVILPGGVFVYRTHNLAPEASATSAGAPGGVTAAVASPEYAVTTSAQMQLDDSASSSADGKALAFSWTQPANSPVATITGAKTATPTVQFAGPGTYVFTLTVTDSAGTTATDTVLITVLPRTRG